MSNADVLDARAELITARRRISLAPDMLCALEARDAAIILSFALQHGADAEAIRRARCRDSQGRPLGADRRRARLPIRIKLRERVATAV